MNSKDVADIRHRAGLSQQQLADLSGVAQPNIAAYEKGTRRPSPKMIERLAAAAKPRPSLALGRHHDEVVSLVRRHRASNPRVFGSVARQDDQAGSDLDLLVRFEEGASLYDLVELQEDLQDLLGVPVDVISEGGLLRKEESASVVRGARPL